MTVTGVEPETIGQVQTLGMEAAALASGGIVVDTETAAAAGVAIGDTVEVTWGNGQKDSLELKQLYEGQAAFSGWAVSLETMEAAGLPAVDSFLYAPLEPDADVAAVRAELDKVQAAYPTVQILDQTEFKETISGQINQLLSLVYALLGLSVIIAIFGVINTLALSIIERTREIGMLRAVGMLRKQVRTMIRWESIVISFFGAFTGVALGLILGVALQRLLVDDGITELAIPWTLIVVVLVATAIVGRPGRGLAGPSRGQPRRADGDQDGVAGPDPQDGMSELGLSACVVAVPAATTANGSGGGVPPNSGHSDWCAHHLHSAEGRGAPVPGLHGALDGRPQRLDLALHRAQVVLVGLVAQDDPGGQVHQLQHRGQLAVHVPQRQGVEAHLEHRPGLEPDARGLAGLVVHDAQLPGGRTVEPVDEAAQDQPGGQLGLHLQLAGRRLEPGGVLHREVGLDQVAGTTQPVQRVRAVVGQHPDHLGALGHEQVPLRPDQADRLVEGPLPGREVVERLEHRMHQRAADGRRAGRLRQAVEDAEPVEQRAGLEVQGPRGRQRPGRARREVGRIGHGANLRRGSDTRCTTPRRRRVPSRALRQTLRPRSASDRRFRILRGSAPPEWSGAADRAAERGNGGSYPPTGRTCAARRPVCGAAPAARLRWRGGHPDDPHRRDPRGDPAERHPGGRAAGLPVDPRVHHRRARGARGSWPSRSRCC